MMSYEKRHPALEGTDRISFGKYRDMQLKDIPAHYLIWLYEETDIKVTNEFLYNYIHNTWMRLNWR
jgi:hypothetical protein